MGKQENPQLGLQTRILDKIVAQLYLDSIAPSHPARIEKLSCVDELFGIERPSAPEMRQFIEEQLKTGRGLGSEMHSRIIEELAMLSEEFRSASMGGDSRSAVCTHIEELFDAILDDEKVELSAEERQRLLESILADILDFGPLEPLLMDDTLTEILVDGPNRIYVERHGKLEDVSARFRDDEHLMRYIRRIVAPLGRRLDEDCPVVDARLPDGSRVNVVIPPVSLVGPVLTIRKFSPPQLTVEDVIRFGAVSEDMIEFLRACVQARLNVVIAGGAGSGKMQFLNIVAGMIPADERIIVVEDTAELRLPEHLKRVVRLESRLPVEGRGGVTLRDLIVNSFRMRPDRIIVNEVQAAEVFDLFQGMNTGHDGTMFTIHAASPRDALARLEMMATFADLSIPVLTIRQMMASAINLITYQKWLPGGQRKILKVTEVTGMQGDVVELKDIFEFRETGIDEEGRITGRFTATGYIPKCLDRIQAVGINLPLDLFTPT